MRLQLLHPCREGMAIPARSAAPIPAGEQMVVAEVQTSWFRGDDEYEYFHARCDPRPPKPVVIHNPPDPARRTCPKCGKMFPVRRDMIQHLKAKHPKETQP
jgi:hypothetical protein